MPLDLKNPFAFAPLSKAEKAARSKEEKTQKEIDMAIRDVVDSAQACLTSDLFAKYKEDYIKAERELIEIGIRLSIVDPISYAVNVHTIFSSLNLLKMLGDSVTKDAEKKV